MRESVCDVTSCHGMLEDMQYVKGVEAQFSQSERDREKEKKPVVEGCACTVQTHYSVERERARERERQRESVLESRLHSGVFTRWNGSGCGVGEVCVGNCKRSGH